MPSHSARQDSRGPEAQGKLIGQTLSLSAPAAAYMRNYLRRQGKTDSTIRVAVVRTHCMGGRGFSYSIDEDSAKPEDTIIESDGAKLLVDHESLQHLKGAQIDYEDTLQGGGLVVRNPNAVGKCHCGRHDLFDDQAKMESGKC